MIYLIGTYFGMLIASAVAVGCSSAIERHSAVIPTLLRRVLLALTFHCLPLMDVSRGCT